MIIKTGLYKTRGDLTVRIDSLHSKNEFYPISGYMSDNTGRKIGMRLNYSRLGNYWSSGIKSKWDLIVEITN
jgi:hypothetical protein